MNKNNQEGLRCPLEKNDNIFFSLVDYRNNLFTSNDPEKIIEFYNGFDNRDQLIQWMKERPKGASYIHEVEGDKDIIVVIPTADFNGKYARICREEIFKGLHMVFVESGENPDPYFNYAHNCNVGIKRAMEYNPRWVVVSNDDMKKIDEPTNLRDILIKLDPNFMDTVFTKPSAYHSIPVCLGRSRFQRKILFSLLDRSHQVKFERKYMVNLFSFPRRRYQRIFFRCIYPFTSYASFGIFSIKFVKAARGYLFDETYINSSEDIDLDLRLSAKKIRKTIIDYRIKEFKGTSLGRDNKRRLRDVAGYSYLNYKLERGMLPVHTK